MLAEELQELRKEIDKIDKKIVNLIDERMKISIKVGETKKKYNAQIFDPKREKEVIIRINYNYLQRDNVHFKTAAEIFN